VTRIRGIAIVGVPIMVMAGGEDACKVIGDYSTVHLTCCSYVVVCCSYVVDVVDVAARYRVCCYVFIDTGCVDIGYVAMCLWIEDVSLI